MPRAAAKLAVGHTLQPDLAPHSRSFADRVILDLPQLGG